MRVLIFPRFRPAVARAVVVAFAVCVIGSACSVAEPKTLASSTANAAVPATVDPARRGATIQIDAGGPGDTVRAFYKLLREKKFKDAIFLTNLRPAIEGLTDNELKEFSLDFEAIAGRIPPEIEINGEIVSGDKATVTANMPNDEGDKTEIEQIRLKRSGDVWVILTVDEEAEARIKKEGKAYFFNLRVETHEDEAKRMLERISKAELATALQNGGVYTDVSSLISAGLLPDDVKTSESTGYNYTITLSADKRGYFADAIPAVYGKTGKLSFHLEPDNKGVSRVSSVDNGGRETKK